MPWYYKKYLNIERHVASEHSKINSHTGSVVKKTKSNRGKNNIHDTDIINQKKSKKITLTI